ncbi:unnamed protein product [Prorocentrum cordatum]|uniref:Uncharacterized protein n=1 Tax=Prorocentrum cordatum TaxID=2364126 RepID=A0ABN9UCR3_9DINO|nr:unnamed protein product [Polarella glacialis]
MVRDRPGASSAPGWHAAEPSPGMRAGVLPCQSVHPRNWPRCPAGPKTVCKGCTVGPDASDEVGPQDDLKTAREACQLAWHAPGVFSCCASIQLVWVRPTRAETQQKRGASARKLTGVHLQDNAKIGKFSP